MKKWKLTVTFSVTVKHLVVTPIPHPDDQPFSLCKSGSLACQDRSQQLIGHQFSCYLAYEYTSRLSIHVS